MREPSALVLNGFAAIAARLGTQTYLKTPLRGETDLSSTKRSDGHLLKVVDTSTGITNHDTRCEAIETFHRFEERAAIREFEGKQIRDEAERDALLELSRILGRSPKGIVEEWDATPELSETVRRYTALDPMIGR